MSMVDGQKLLTRDVGRVEISEMRIASADQKAKLYGLQVEACEILIRVVIASQIRGVKSHIYSVL